MLFDDEIKKSALSVINQFTLLFLSTNAFLGVLAASNGMQK
jgi:hypothetical protein